MPAWPADRFGILVPHSDRIVPLAESLRRACFEPCLIDGRDIFLKASVGVVHSTDTVANASVISSAAESVEQIDFLAEQGCNVGQGYLFSRPLNAKGFAHFVGLEAK